VFTDDEISTDVVIYVFQPGVAWSIPQHLQMMVFLHGVDARQRAQSE
jgi:hypothetical protein